WLLDLAADVEVLKKGQEPLCEAPEGPFRQQFLTPFLGPRRGVPVNAFRILACLSAACLIAQGPARGQDAAKEITNSIGMKLVLIPAGKFVMGSPDTEAEREAGEDQHEVAITRPFYLGAYVVTQGQFEKVMGKNPSFFHPKNGGSLDHPAEQVRLGDARAFCTKLSALPEEKKAGRTYR